MIIELILSIFNIFVGFSAFVTFFIMANYQASVWAFLTGLIASITFYLHWLKYKNSISEYYSAYSLWSLAWLGYGIFALGVSGFIYNVITFCLLHPPILPVKDSVIISVVFSFIASKNGAILFWYARKYAHFTNPDHARLIETEGPSNSQQQSNETP